MRPADACAIHSPQARIPLDCCKFCNQPFFNLFSSGTGSKIIFAQIPPQAQSDATVIHRSPTPDSLVVVHRVTPVDRSSKPRMLKEKISPDRDPGAPNLSRRHALKTLAAATQLTFLAPAVVFAQSGASRGASAVAPLASAVPSLDAPGFMHLSMALTGHASMNTAFGTRLFATLSASDSSFASRSAALARLVRAGQSPQQLLAAANAAGLHDVALAIVAGWYTGTVTRDHQSKLVAYADSLMYATVEDGLSPPTYCADGPLWWQRPPPAAGVSTPAEAAKARLAAPAPITNKQA
jgi:fructose 5-dehydrogenase small subunit